MWRALVLGLVLLAGCSSDAGLEKIERLEEDLERAREKNRELNEQMASCVETRKLLEAKMAAQKKVDETIEEARRAPAPSGESPPPLAPPKPRRRCDPGDPLCSEL